MNITPISNNNSQVFYGNKKPIGKCWRKFWNKMRNMRPSLAICEETERSIIEEPCPFRKKTRRKSGF